MKFFIDTANLDQIREAQALGVLDGVTTNPSLMAKEGITGKENIINHYKAICEIVDGDVSAEVIATDFDGMVREGEELAALHNQIVVKLPMIADGIKAAKYFNDKGIKTNVTLVFSAGQALLAAKAGATYVSPFIGRLDDISTDGLNLIRRIEDAFRGGQFLSSFVRRRITSEIFLLSNMYLSFPDQISQSTSYIEIIRTSIDNETAATFVHRNSNSVTFDIFKLH